MPLRFPRPVIPAIAVGMAAAWVAVAGAPALADQVRSEQWWLGALHVPQAWQADQGSGVTVAVLSDGVAAAQPDLAGSVTAGPDFTGTAQSPGSSFFGVAGTPEASLIAGHGNGPVRGAGIIGIAPRAHILSVRVTLPAADTSLDSTATGAALPSAIAQGIRYAVAHHASVIDLPLDPGRPSPADLAALPVPRLASQAPQLAGIIAAQGGSVAEQQAVAYALSKGVVLVAPAGDNALASGAANFPASYHGVISVGAFDASFNRGSFSSSQPYVTLTGPGVSVTAASAFGGYTTVSSTTAASAVVSGIAALIRARYPGLTPGQVQTALTSSTVYKPPPGKPGSGAGTVDAGRALLAAASLAAPANARAGAGAQALASPPPPQSSPVASDGLAGHLIRAALISLAVLVVALGGVFWYSRATRRRRQDSARVTAEWSRSSQHAFSAYGADARSEADKMLEFFAAPSSDPSLAPSPFSSGVLTTSRGRAGRSGGGGTESDSVASDMGAWASVAPAPRAASRNVRVSGAPPWEPAERPASELPWAAVPGSPGGPPTGAMGAIGPGPAGAGGLGGLPGLGGADAAGAAGAARAAGATGAGGGAGRADGDAAESVWPVSPSAATTASSLSWDEIAASASAAARPFPAGGPPAQRAAESLPGTGGPGGPAPGPRPAQPGPGTAQLGQPGPGSAQLGQPGQPDPDSPLAALAGVLANDPVFSGLSSIPAARAPGGTASLPGSPDGGLPGAPGGLPGSPDGNGSFLPTGGSTPRSPSGSGWESVAGRGADGTDGGSWPGATSEDAYRSAPAGAGEGASENPWQSAPESGLPAPASWQPPESATTGSWPADGWTDPEPSTPPGWSPAWGERGEAGEDS